VKTRKTLTKRFASVRIIARRLSGSLLSMVESRALMAAEVREALERVQAISLELSEELDAYQDKHAR
jgi:hypothetical protein